MLLVITILLERIAFSIHISIRIEEAKYQTFTGNPSRQGGGQRGSTY